MLQALFKSPWNGDSTSGLQHLEHVNVCIPRHDPARRFYYDILGFVPDARRAQNIGKESGTIWANMGTTQIHLPEGKVCFPQSGTTHDKVGAPYVGVSARTEKQVPQKYGPYLS